ncbi:myo-inosose-2 dehydratase [Lentibacillus salinarum]|uniref:Inosose dehydratase n=1 Tax=Lentibacillus salinarum TaxID=446820 RepID=A0ABW3ZVN3_9BACI
MVNQDRIHFGCAPIAWTNDDMPELGEKNSFEQCISEMALAQYTGTEIGNKYPKEPDVLKRYLEPRNLQVASAWFSSYLTTKPIDETIESFIEHRDFLHQMGAKVIVVSEQGHSIQKVDTPLFEEKPIFTDDEWDKLTHGLNTLGDLANEKGMNVVFHHHMGTGVQTTEEIDRLMQNTDPQKVFLLYDTGHLFLSGENLEDIYFKYQERIKHIHFKDIRGNIAKDVKENKDSFLTGVKKGVFTVPGDGAIDFKPIMKAIFESDYRGWIVVEAEQDPAKANPFEYAVKAKKYMDDIIPSGNPV